MDVVSLSPVRVASLLWRPSSGGFVLTVVCKATYELRPVELRFARQQDDPSHGDGFWDDDPNRSVRVPSDFAPFKPRADVMVVGKAFAPSKTPVRSLLARLGLAGIDKTIEVCGDRAWTPEGGLREGPPFVSMQLCYERAAVGPDNLVGVRVDPRSGGPLPNLQMPPGPNGMRPDAMAPVGFGPIAASWPSRRIRLGAAAASFPEGRLDDYLLPDDFDASFFNAAPPDQQTDRIEPGAVLMLENLTPQHPRLVTKLPNQRPRAFVQRNGGLEEVSLACDTLWIDTDRGVCTLTWRGQIGVHGPHDEGRVVVLLEQLARPLTWAEIQQQCGVEAAPIERAAAHASDDHGTAVHEISAIMRAPVDTALPFSQATAEPYVAPRAATNRPPPWLETSAIVPAPALAINSGDTLQPGALRVDPSWPRDGDARPPPPMSTPALPQAPPPRGVTSWSEAAAPLPSLATSTFAPPPFQALPPPLPVPALIPAAPPPVARAASVDIVELVAFDPATPDRARLHAPWQELIAAIQPVPAEIAYDDDPAEEPPEVKDRRDVFGVLTDAVASSLDELDAVVAAATSPSGSFDPPLLVLRGELELTFSDLERLKASLGAVAPFTSGPDKRLKDTFEATTEALKSPYLPGSARAIEGLTNRLRDAFPQVASSLPAGYLDQQIERILVEQRHHQKRTILGKSWVRALLWQRGGVAVPTYVPDMIAAKLPLYARFPARLIVEVNLQQDQYEAHPCALLCLALARVTPARAPGRGRPPNGG